MNISNHEFDVDRDGKVSERDIERVRRMLEIESQNEKAETQKHMAWSAMISMIVFTIALFTPLISDSRVSALADLLGLFYIAQAGVVGAYMGVMAWISKSSRSRYNRTSDDLEQYSSRRETRDGE